MSLSSCRFIAPANETKEAKKERETLMLQECFPGTTDRVYIRCFDCECLVTHAVNDTCISCIEEQDGIWGSEKEANDEDEDDDDDDDDSRDTSDDDDDDDDEEEDVEMSD